MNLKKGLSYLAVGFLFTLVNINITMNNQTVNLMPEFVGWILLALAFVPMGKYTLFKDVLHWIPIVLAVYYAFAYLFAFVMPNVSFGWLGLIALILELVYFFRLFDCLESVARDYAFELVPRIHTLKILYIVCLVGVIVLMLLSLTVYSFGIFPILLVVDSLAFLVVAVVICVTLFQLRKAVPDGGAEPPAGNSWGDGISPEL